MRKARAFTCLCLLLLSACMVGPDYEQTRFDVGEQYRAKTIDSTGAPSIHWWRHFQDPVIDSLLSDGMGSNLDIKEALARVNEARAIAGEGRLGLLPETIIGGEYTEGKFGTATNPFFEESDPSYRAYRGAASLDWELDLFGRVRRIIEQRDANQEALEAALSDVLISVHADIVDTYIGLRVAEVEKEVLLRNAKIQQESVEITTSLFEAGASSELDVARSKSQLFRTRSELPLVEARVQANRSRLAVLLGRSPADLPAYLQATPIIPSYQGPLSVPDPEALLRRRPDVREAERQAAALTADIGVETAEFFPRITILGTVGLEARNFSDLGDTNTDFYSVGPSITWRVLNARRILRRIDAADERAKQAVLNFHRTSLEALEDVENALTNFHTAKVRYAHISKATRESQKASEVSREQYKAGGLDFLDVLAADRARLELEQIKTISEGDVQRSYVALFRAFGGGWEETIPSRR